MHDTNNKPDAASAPRILIELEEGAIKRIVADQPITTITIDPTGPAGTPEAIGLIVSKVDEVFSGRDFDHLLQNRLDRILKMTCHPTPGLPK